ncbi:MAG: electron transfer flavoprotein subunit beta/FixA family protein [Erysipelotrichaceae bacterium]|nr:electron transfer flavoprotein subunit beta/FixA family protein [Erysipelotrichaceae bacterium]
MKIVVCIKQVPASNDAKIDPETKRIIRDAVKSILNPFDNYALEEGVGLREKFGGEVIALTMGPPAAEAVIKEAIALGVDSGILLSDRAFGGSDTWATSYALAKAIEKIGNVDLVICGKQAIDGDTAQVGPGIAAHLNWQQATYLMEIKRKDEKVILAKRLHESGYDICEMTLPAVVTVVKGINTPRVPTLKGRLTSLNAEIPVWKPSDIDANVDQLGLNGSPTRVVRTDPPAPRLSSTIKIEGSAQHCAKELVRQLRLRSIV